MEGGLIRVSPDKEKARSILKMATISLDMVKTIDLERFPSNVVKEYYDIIRELISTVLLLDGYKTYGEGAHMKLIEYLETNCKRFSGYEISVIDDLRNLRNKISYDGFFVQKDYVKRRKEIIEEIIAKLIKTIEGRI